MSSALLEIIPEFKDIQDAGLRNKAMAVWTEAMSAGRWTFDDLKDMPFTLLIKETEVNLVAHTRAVTQTAMNIAQVLDEAYKSKVKVNTDYLLAGALLHDVGKMFEYKREGGRFVQSENGRLLRHPVSGAAFASRFDLPQEIIHIIAAHSKEGDGLRRTIEAVIVNHADFVNFDVFKE
jgi:putative nucleotidyltransferase with HDIG domain